MDNSYLHLLQISFSNLYKQKIELKKKINNLIENDKTKDLFQILFEIEPSLKNKTVNENKIIDKFLINNELINK